MQESPCCNAESSSEVLLLLVLAVFRCAIQPLVMTSLCTSPISHLFHSLRQGSLFVRIYLTSVWIFHTSFNCATIQFWSHTHTNTHAVSKGVHLLVGIKMKQLERNALLVIVLIRSDTEVVESGFHLISAGFFAYMKLPLRPLQWHFLECNKAYLSGNVLSV